MPRLPRARDAARCGELSGDFVSVPVKVLQEVRAAWPPLRVVALRAWAREGRLVWADWWKGGGAARGFLTLSALAAAPSAWRDFAAEQGARAESWAAGDSADAATKAHAAAVGLFQGPQFDQLGALKMKSFARRGAQSGGGQALRSFAQTLAEPAAPPDRPRIAAPRLIFERELRHRAWRPRARARVYDGLAFHVPGAAAAALMGELTEFDVRPAAPSWRAAAAGAVVAGVSARSATVPFFTTVGAPGGAAELMARLQAATGGAARQEQQAPTEAAAQGQFSVARSALGARAQQFLGAAAERVALAGGRALAAGLQQARQRGRRLPPVVARRRRELDAASALLRHPNDEKGERTTASARHTAGAALDAELDDLDVFFDGLLEELGVLGGPSTEQPMREEAAHASLGTRLANEGVAKEEGKGHQDRAASLDWGRGVVGAEKLLRCKVLAPWGQGGAPVNDIAREFKGAMGAPRSCPTLAETSGAPPGIPESTSECAMKTKCRGDDCRWLWRGPRCDLAARGGCGDAEVGMASGALLGAARTSSRLSLLDALVARVREPPRLAVIREGEGDREVVDRWLAILQDIAIGRIQGEISLPSLHDDRAEKRADGKMGGAEPPAMKKASPAKSIIQADEAHREVARLMQGRKGQEFRRGRPSQRRDVGDGFAAGGGALAAAKRIRASECWSIRVLRCEVVAHARGETAKARGYSAGAIVDRRPALKRRVKKRNGGQLPPTSDRRAWGRFITEFQYRKVAPKGRALSGGRAHPVAKEALMQHVAEVCAQGKTRADLGFAPAMRAGTAPAIGLCYAALLAIACLPLDSRGHALGRVRPVEPEPCDAWGAFDLGRLGGALGGTVVTLLFVKLGVSDHVALSAPECVGATSAGVTYTERHGVGRVRRSGRWDDVPYDVDPAGVYRLWQEPTAAAEHVYLRNAELLADHRYRTVAAKVETSMDRAVAADAWVLPVMRSGARGVITWAALSARVREEDFCRGWLVTGAHRSLWRIEVINNEGMNVDGHDDRFRAVAKLESTQWGAREHFQCRQFVRLGLISGQCDDANLQACEAIFRHRQTIEYSHVEEVRERKGGNQSGRLWIDEQTHLAGSAGISCSSRRRAPTCYSSRRRKWSMRLPWRRISVNLAQRRGLSSWARKMDKSEGVWSAPSVAPSRPPIGVRLRAVNSRDLPLVTMSPLDARLAILYLSHFRRSLLVALPVVDVCLAGAVSGFNSVMLFDVRRVVVDLNSLRLSPDVAPGGEGQLSGGHLSRTQHRIMDHARGSVGALGAPPAGVDTSGAPRRLRARGFYGSDEDVKLGNDNPEFCSRCRPRVATRLFSQTCEAQAGAGASRSLRAIVCHLQDRRWRGAWHLEYVDNVVAISAVASKVHRLAPAVVGGVREAGGLAVAQRVDELAIWEGISPLLWRNLKAAAAAAVSDDPEVQRPSGVHDSGPGGLWGIGGGPPRAGTAADVLGSGLGDARENAFREVPLKLLQRGWKIAGRYRWKFEGPMPIFDGGLAAPSAPQPLVSLEAPRVGVASFGWVGPVRPAAAAGGDAAAGDALVRLPLERVGWPAAMGSRARAMEAARRRAAATAADGMTVCQTHSALPAMLRHCRGDFASFKRWLKRQGRPMPKGEVDADPVLAQFSDEMYLDGARLSPGQRVLAAALCHPSSLSKVMRMIAMWMWPHGLWEEGLVTRLTFEMCRRPNEPFALRAKDLVPPAAGARAGGSWSLTPHARERGVASKTEEFDQAQLLDLERQAGLGPALAALLEARFGAQWRLSVLKRPAGSASAPPLFAISSAQAGQAVEKAAQALGLRLLGQIRHRDRWRAHSSLRRCEKGARLGEVLERLTPPLRAHALRCADMLAAVAAGCCGGASRSVMLMTRLGKNQNLLMGRLSGGLIIGFHVALLCQACACIRDRALPLTPPPQPGLPVRAAPVAPVVRHVQTPPPSGLQPGAPADGALTSELTCCAGSPAALSTTPKGPSASPGSRHMVVEVDAIARIVLPEPDGRAACGAPAPGDAPAADRAAGQALAEASAGVADFVPRYNVCVNPLCRRKWKQLTPKVLPLFCPPCKRSLEDGIPGSKDMPEATLTESMCERWRAICTELAQILGGQDSAAAKSADAGGDAGLRLAEGHIPASSLALWSSTLSAFAGCFPVRPDPEDVRNWNSVHSRRKHFRGVIHRCRRRFVCILEAQEELEEDLRVSRRALQGAREYPVLDWHEDLSEGQEVLFTAFPNPSVRERDRVSRIVRLLNAPEGGAASENKPAALAGAGGALGDSFKDSFADLVEWSTQQPSEDVPEADSAAAARPLAPAPSARAAPAQAEQRAAATPLSLE
ncbi:unnamed protein product, partial [Prorocentrum cordatum]